MSLSEDDLIATLFAPLAGPGGLGLRDDAAVISPEPDQDLVVTVDALVAGVHFHPDDPPEAIAAKALGVNLSDLAAKAADPAGFLLALALPASLAPEWLESFARGLGDAATRYGCPLLGGDTVRSPGPLTLSITAFGTVPQGRMVPRTGARPGDLVYVSGTIGDAALGLALRTGQDPTTLGAVLLSRLTQESRAHLLERYLYPRPRLALRAVLRAWGRAAMDVSDGLVGDLTKMLRVSGVGGRIDLARLPVSDAARQAFEIDRRAFTTAVTGGDDYEILASVAPENTALFEREAALVSVPVTCIGTVTAELTKTVFHDRAGKPIAFARGSFQHF